MIEKAQDAAKLEGPNPAPPLPSPLGKSNGLDP